MLFQSYEFALFLVCVLLLFYAAPGSGRAVVLLIANLTFFGYAAPGAVVWLAITILTTYGCGLFVEKRKTGGKALAAGCMILNLVLLAVFRYFPVWEGILNGFLGGGIRRVRLDVAFDWGWVAPLGISFYTLQAVGYLADVAAGKYPAERNPIHFAVFVSFFPSLSSGPIERGDRFLPQLKQVCGAKRRQLWNYDRTVIGLISVLWGFFLKMVVADRAAILVNHLYGLYENTDSFTMLMAALFYSGQIFCDFASYSCIAVGVAQIMGFSLIQNFRQPYLAAGFKDFWSRWHISLSGWLRDYVYIPLGGNRRGMWRKEQNIVLTFLVSGLWHGGGLQFLVWGALHGAFQAAEDVARRIWKRIAGRKAQAGRTQGFLRQPEEPGKRGLASYLLKGLGRVSYGLFTFAVVTVLWIFFRSDSVGMALVCLENLFTKWQGFLVADQLIFVMGLDRTEFMIAVFGFGLVLLFELMSEWKRKPAAEWIYASPLPVRFGICLFLLGTVFVFGKYGIGFDASDFIYMGF